MLSVFDIFKIGIGPSSSHTVGPMKAGKLFVDELETKGLLPFVTRIAGNVCGSLSLTGKGHRTDMAVILGLAGNLPDTVDIDAIPAFLIPSNSRRSFWNTVGRPVFRSRRWSCKTSLRCTGEPRSKAISRPCGTSCAQQWSGG